MKRLIPDYITKIEGHGILNINFKKPYATLQVTEGERLFEGLVIGRNYSDGPWLTSRICGICPTSHNLASIKAIENALEIEISPVTIELRKLIQSAQIIQSHNLHLFYLALPDYLNLTDSIQIAEKYPSQFNTSLVIKRIADKILKTIAGRSIHPISSIVGGFSNEISQNDIADLGFELEKSLDEAVDFVKLFANLKYPELLVETENLATTSEKEYGMYDGKIFSSLKNGFLPQRYSKEIIEKIKPGSTAKFGYRGHRELTVGALARINLNHKQLNPKAKTMLAESNFEFPSKNPFLNNFAQSIEILHFLQEAIKIINRLQKMSIDVEPEPIKLKNGEGIGAIEAPRGCLYHHYKIGKDGKIKYLNIVTPTVQNLSGLEKSARKLIIQYKNSKRATKKRLIEMLVRAYDPCLTCSVH